MLVFGPVVPRVDAAVFVLLFLAVEKAGLFVLWMIDCKAGESHRVRLPKLLPEVDREECESLWTLKEELGGWVPCLLGAWLVVACELLLYLLHDLGPARHLDHERALLHRVLLEGGCCGSAGSGCALRSSTGCP